MMNATHWPQKSTQLTLEPYDNFIHFLSLYPSARDAARKSSTASTRANQVRSTADTMYSHFKPSSSDLLADAEAGGLLAVDEARY